MNAPLHEMNLSNEANTLLRQRWIMHSLSLLLLVGGFSGLIHLFQGVDFYHQHFFGHSGQVLIYNLSRGLIALYVTWIIYASGYGILRLCAPVLSRQHFTLLDQFILGFGIGLGFWHLLMLVLGTYNLYYMNVITAICTVVLLFSVTHFTDFLSECTRRAVNARAGFSLTTTTKWALAAGLVWLFIMRGVYPNGGGDYFTHYFYYYMAVLKNHGLAPNDVWYHYYYSKGAGLHFLGMLLMDPEAPAVMTFICVAVAALALANLVEKLTPRTLWPIFCAMLYILYNLVSLSHGGGEFQKTHEETTAMVILGVWVLCLFELDPKNWVKPAFILLASLAIGSAILTQAVTVYFACFFGLQVVINLFQKNWQKCKFYVALGAIATMSVLINLWINYEVTGLATDQALNLMWKFANLEKLNQWGVLPNVMMVTWIRDNYDMVAVPWTLSTVTSQLINFMRVDVLGYLVTISACLLVVYGGVHYNMKREGKKRLDIEPITQPIKSTFITLTLFLLICAFVSVLAGHSQAVSYFRFSSFFFPLVVLLCTIICAYACTVSKSLKYLGPVFLFTLTLYSWHHWGVLDATNNAAKYFIGEYSLGEAYTHLPDGLSFGGINPGAYAAMQQVPAGSRIWSTNVDSYCMAPDCQIESTISFSMSPNLNAILNGTPSQAKKILQDEKLNYFLVSKDSMLLDLLPFSKLFTPASLQQNFGIKWTDGSMYLLTWKGKDTQEISPKFIKMYKSLLAKSDHPWFKFNEAITAMNKTMQEINSMPHPWKPIEFPWRKERAKQLALIRIPAGIRIVHASYGRNCIWQSLVTNYAALSANSATEAVKQLCQRKNSCEFYVGAKPFADLVNDCSKSFNVSYQCLPSKNVINRYVKAPSTGEKIMLTCSSDSTRI